MHEEVRYPEPVTESVRLFSYTRILARLASGEDAFVHVARDD